MSSQEITAQVHLTLCDYAHEFDVVAIVAEIIAVYGTAIHVGDIPADDYWALVARHDTGRT
jgi:hypothetical protein